MAFDGSLVFDTQIDTGNTRKELAELQQEFYDVNSAMKSQIRTVKDLEQYYKELEEASENAIDPKRIEKLNREMTDTGLKLQDARKRLIDLRAQSNEMKDTLKEFTQSAQTMGTSLTSLGKRILGFARRVFIFTVIARAFNSLRNLIADSIPGIEDLKASFTELKIAIVRAAAPLISAFIPVLQATIKYIVNLVNTIRQAITAILSLFGADVADDAEVTAKATNSLTGSIGKLGKAGKKASKDLAQFDEIMQIGTNAANDADLGEMQKEAQIASEAIKPLTDLEKLLAELSLFSIAGILGGKEGLGIAATIKAIGEAVEAYGDIIENGINWGNLSKNFQSDIWLLLGGTLLGGKKGAGIAAVINAVKDAVEAAQDIIEKGINWQNLLLNFQSDTWAVLGGALLGGKRGAGIAAVLTGIKDQIIAAKDIIEKGINWQNLLLNFQGDLWTIIGGTLLGGKKGAGLALTLVAIKNAVLGAKDILEKGINWQNLTMFLPSALVLLYKLRNLLAAKGLVAAATGAGGLAAAGVGAVGLVAILYNLKQILDDFKNGTVGWTTALHALTAAFTAVGAALMFINLSNPLGWILLAIGALGTLALAIYENWDKVKAYWEKFVEWLQKFWSAVKDWFAKLWDGIAGIFKKVWKGIADWFKSLWKGIADWFKNWWDNSFLGKTFKKVSEWFGGGSKKSVRVSTVNTTRTLSNLPSTMQIPALASGAVIPPNNPYLTIVGDQTSGTNIETPLQTMIDAFKQALAETGYGKAVMEVDGTTFAQLVYKYNGAESARVGVNLLSKEGQ